MKDDRALVVVAGEEPVVSTEVLAKGFGVAHKAVMQLIRKYESDFQEIRTFAIVRGKSSGGRPTNFFLLNEEQAAFLGTLAFNTREAVAFKRKLTREFFRLRKALAQVLTQKQNAEWPEQRRVGKITRRQETDAIKRFVEYATFQGSQSAQKYYMAISKMQNQALFLLEQKFPNLREALNLTQLSVIVCADQIVARALAEGMERNMPYKEIYQLAKRRVETFAEIHGKSVVPGMIGHKKALELSA